ncbi:HAD-like domain-containing protein [Phycomyces nitens]|nr:HAD-like domain-containing protein [Phycomyces nitens]
MSRIRLITFDAYNTLFKPRGGLSAQYAQEAARLGISVSKSTITQHFGNSYKKQLDRAPFYGQSLGMTSQAWWEELVYNTFYEAGVDKKVLDSKFDRLFNALYTRFSTAGAYETFPDVVGTLKELRSRGFYMGIVSNSDERLTKVVENLKLDHYFDFVLPSCVAGYEKPDSAFFDVALRMVDDGITPEDSLHVGDDAGKDYRGALKAGWNAVLLRRGKMSYEDSSPTFLSDPTGEFPKTIMTLKELYPLATTIYKPNSGSVAVSVNGLS